MEFVVQKGEMVIMEDDETYMVLSTIEYNGEGYLHMVKSGEDLFDDEYEIDLKRTIYVKHVHEGDELYLDIVTDPELIEKLEKV